MRITAVITTATAPIECLAWSVLSLVLNSDLEKIDQIIVSINGPDDRTGVGKSDLQNKKQAFLEDLAAMGLPITIMRTWSRVGFSQPVDMALSAVRTRHYLLMHDDTVVLRDWQGQAEKFFAENSRAVMISSVPLANNAGTNFMPLTKGKPNTMSLNSVELDSSFIVCDSDRISKRWQSYYLQKQAVQIVPSDGIFSHLREDEKNVLFSDAHLLPKILKLGHRPVSDIYSQIHFKMGAWIHYDARKAGYVTKTFDTNTTGHMERMSWFNESVGAAKTPPKFVLDAQAKILSSKYSDVYLKYVEEKQDRTDDISKLKVFIGVLTYNRVFAYKLLSAWNNANHYGAKLAIFHSYDAEDAKHLAQRERLLQYNPDFYILTPNPVRNPGFEKFRYAKTNELMPDWDVSVLMCDDQIPMKKDFLRPFLEEFLDPEVGMVGSQYVGSDNYVLGNFRTSFFGLRKEVVQKIPEEFWTYGFRQQESGKNNYSQTVRSLGYKLRQPPKYVPENIWDCDHGASSFLWSKYELQFRDS